MATVTTSPEKSHDALAPRPKLPELSVGTSIGAITRALGQAYLLAYVAPYRADKRPPPGRGEDWRDEDGRDPDW